MTTPGQTAARSRKKIPGLAYGAAGAIAAVAYGVTGAKLHFGPPLVMMGLGGVALAMCGLGLWRILDPLLRPDAASAEGPRAPSRLKDLDREKQLVLKAIREIELDYQMRKVAEADYKEMTHRYRARAMRLLREIDAGDDYRALIEQELKTRLAAIEAAGGHGCATCGTPNDTDAEFCKKCGAKLEARA